MTMSVDEALRIAEIFEQDDVIAVSAQAVRTLAKEVKRLQEEIVACSTKGFKPEEYV